HCRPRALEQPNDNFFAPSRGNSRNSEIVTTGDFGTDVAILRDAAIGNVEVRKNLDPNGEVVVKPTRQFGGLLQQPIDTIADSSAGAARLNVYVARTDRCSFRKNHFLNTNDRRRIAIRIAR